MNIVLCLCGVRVILCINNYQALVKLLKRAIKEFGKTNRLKAIEFSKKLKNVIDRYNSRNTISDVEDIIEDVVDNLSEELEKIFSDLKKEKQSFEARRL